MQDIDRGLSKWFSTRLGARWQVRESEMAKWTIESENDTGLSDEGYWQWWTVSDGEKSYKCESSEADATWLCNLLNSEPSEHAAQADARIAELEEALAKEERRAITFGDIVHTQVMAMRAAVVAWQREDAAAGMKWISNTLCGPGHLPSEEAIALGAQALFDKETAEHEAFRAAHPGPAAPSRAALGPKA